MSDDTDVILSDEFHRRYALGPQLGHGVSGRVFKGTQVSLGRDVAIKIFHEKVSPDERFYRRFALEAESLARIAHPGVTRLLDFGQDSGFTYLVMELVEAPTLRVALNRKWKPTHEQVVDLGIQLLEILLHVHQLGILHRDMKPENTFLMTDLTVRIADFGLAIISGEETAHTTRGMMVGTPVYLAPELFTGAEYSEDTDLYSVGLMLYELLSGTVPFMGPGNDFYVRKMQPLPLLTPCVPGLDPRFASVIERSVDPDPDRRFFDGDELLEALRGLQKSGNGAAARTQVARTQLIEPESSAGVPKRTTRAFAALLVTIPLAIALAMPFITSTTPPATPVPRAAPASLDAILRDLDPAELNARIESGWGQHMARPENRTREARQTWMREVFDRTAARLDTAEIAAAHRQFIQQLLVTGERRLGRSDLETYDGLNELLDLQVKLKRFLKKNEMPADLRDPLTARIDPILPSAWIPATRSTIEAPDAVTLIARRPGMEPLLPAGPYRTHEVIPAWAPPILFELKSKDPVEALDTFELSDLALPGTSPGKRAYEHPFPLTLPPDGRIEALEVAIGRNRFYSEGPRIVITITPLQGSPIRLIFRHVPEDPRNVSQFLPIDPALVGQGQVHVSIEAQMPEAQTSFENVDLYWVSLRWRSRDTP